ncbi:unnamed protein product [Eruca vesicaria subsp. sativa]|uniref:non-specific serine/threonine protein kinase n=1 Tax=Eruca vesicaria subsp. sativa TaxID=29727 RepID=A0ABC8JWF1_ERUVS|nr:unnamed protein product [Eruca vesicaria subsp. sativa]
MIDKKMRSKSIGLLVILIYYVLSLSVFFLKVTEAVCNLQDRDSLLLFSINVSSPLSPLHWNSSTDCCSWEGISCDNSPQNRVTAILLPSRGLSGPLPSSVLNLRRLSQLNLSHNRLSGPLPQGFFSVLDQLTVLDLSYNSFNGKSPFEQSSSTNGSNQSLQIQTVDLSSNLLQGDIISDSVFLQRALRLTSFNVSNNSFTGPLPSFICKISPQLTKLDFSHNKFTGVISQGLGRCSRLRVLRAGFNDLFGEIPKEIYNLTNLEELRLPANHLSGKIDDEITRLTKLTCLDLYFNQLQGEIPKDIGKLVNLRKLQLHINNFTGSVPISLANCTKLVKLNLRVNNLGGALSNVDFSRFQSLSILDLGNNSFTGDFPSTVYSCKNLTAMRFAGNKLTGQISPQVLELKSLSFFTFSQNQMTNITGALSILQHCRKLSTLIMARNFYDETIPSNEDFLDSDAFPKLQIFGTGGSRLRGVIPAWLIKLKSVELMDLSQNQLEGSIPGWLGTLPNLFYLDLSSNFLTGELPKELFQLSALRSQNVYDATERSYLELPVFVSPNNITSNQQYNQISSLPPAIYVNKNNLNGTIPVEIGQLKVLLVLELQIPTQPASTEMNKEKVNIKLIVGVVIGIFFAIGLIMVMFALWVMVKKRVNPGDSELAELEISSHASYSEVPTDSEKDISLVLLFGNSRYDGKDLTIFELLKATDNFSQANIIGCGGFGLVYKATLDNGTKLAVKKLTGDYGMMEKEFKAEVEVLSRAKHENLVDLQGYCIHDGARILIYSFMENGSLDYWLHENPEGPAQLDWPKRLHIMRGASSGLAYMHEVCEPHIVHRDIKSSNILLDGSFKAYLGDFGLSRLILPYRTHVTTELVGTLGYIPPEYGQAWVATLRGDVYSFGVVMLELLTGKRPMEVFKPKVSREIVAWVHQTRKDGTLKEVFDPLLRETGNEREMLRVLDIACMCVNQNPMRRPNIQQVVDWLNDVEAQNTNQSNREEETKEE